MMKKFTVFFVLAFVFVLLAGGQVSAQTLTTANPNLPPPSGTYISPSLYHQLYAGGIVIKDISHSKFNQSQPPPPPGGTQIHNFLSQVTMMVSVDGGQTFSPVMVPNVAVTVRVSSNPSQDVGNSRAFDTEMLSLNIQGGSLPAGVMVRESPTLQSLGKTRVSLEPDGTYKINSFFDIFTELSLNGGASWSPSTNGAGHMALQGDPKPPIVTTSDNVPPIPGHYVSPDEFHQLFAGGIVIKDISHEGFLHNQPPPADSLPGTESFGSTVKMQLSTDGGNNFFGFEAPANVSVVMQKTSPPDANPRTFDTEILQLNIQGGGLPAGVMIRESPTLASTGKTAITQDPNGTFRIGSFFDIFTELSIDGGASWSPSLNGSTRMEVEPAPPPIVVTSPALPPIPTKYVSPPGYQEAYANGYIIKDFIHHQFDHNEPLPPPGGSSTHSYTSHDELQLSTDGGNTFSPMDMFTNATEKVTSGSDVGPTRSFDTEMLQLDISSPGFMIRESPSLPSKGRTTLRTDPGPQFHMSSFFDVFTELSTDGGESWVPSVGDPLQMELQIATGGMTGTKYEDQDGDGTRGPSEPGLAGWKIVAQETSTLASYSAVTDGSGNFSFLNLPLGTYRVQELLQTGWMQTGGEPYYTITLGEGQPTTGVNFGNFTNGSICGQKFNDRNGNGIQDPGELGLPGWTICIQRQQPPPSSSFPTSGGTDYLGGTLATIDVNLFPAYGGIHTTICAFGPTTVQRGNPSGGSPGDSMKTEITTLEMVGTLPPPFPATDTFHLRHVADRRSFGAIQGNSYPAISFFDVFYELEVMGKTFVNYTATHMSAGGGINTIPPAGQNYLGFNTYLVNKFDPTDTLCLINTVNHCVGGGQAGTVPCNCPTKQPPNQTPPGSPLGTMCVTTDANGNFCFNDLPQGTYVLSEVPQAGWDMTSLPPAPVTIYSGTHSTGNDFGNHAHTTRVCVFPYYDKNHNNQRDADDPALTILPEGPVCFDVIGAGFSGSMCTDANSPSACVDLPEGEYDIFEHVPAGYVTSDPKGGIPLHIQIPPGSPNIDLMWGNAAAATDSTFRTASYNDWARTLGQDPKGKLKSIKCKADKVEFKLNLVVPPTAPGGTPFTQLKIAFNMPTNISAVWGDGKSKSLQLCNGVQDPKLKIWTFDFKNCGTAPLQPLQVVQFDGYGLKGSLEKPAYLWSNTDALTKPLTVKGSLTPFRKNGVPGDTIKQTLRLPMPNLVNVGEELQKQLPFPFTTGAATGGHSVIYFKYNDVQKSLVKVIKGVDKLHDGAPRWLDVFDKNGIPNPPTPISKQVKGLPPDKHNNSLYGQALALQLNILASRLYKFPLGFGSLIWNDPASNYCSYSGFNGKTVDTIMSQLNQYLGTGVDPKGSATPSDYWCVAYWLNTAFNCPIDTIRWSCDKLLLKGCTILKTVPYLSAPQPGSVPAFTEPMHRTAASYTPPEHYELQQNYPNPFNPVTTISFTLPEDANVTLKVYNALGQEIATLLDHEEFSEGDNDVQFDASDFPSGVYFYRVTAQGLGDPDQGTVGQTYTSVKKMVLLK